MCSLVSPQPLLSPRYDRSINDNTAFWRQMGTERLDWFRDFDTVTQGGFEEGDVSWFVGGKLNVSYNCIDRHIANGKGGLPVATLSHPSGVSCEVVVAGAHVTSWKTKDGVERLFVSSASKFGSGAAIRGGIPVCWPQFAGRGPLAKHGFVRTSEAWEIAEMSSESGDCKLVLTICDSPTTRALWPHSCSSMRRPLRDR